MGESQFYGRRPVSLDGPSVRLRRGQKEFFVSAHAFLSARHDGYIAGLDGLHPQSPDHERSLSSGAAACTKPGLGQGDIERRRAPQRAVASILRPAEYFVVRARAQGRIGFCWHIRRAQPRLSQYWIVERGM